MALAEHAGLILDPWQQISLHNMLAIREETYEAELFDYQLREHFREEMNKWAAKEFGLVVSRQNGKGSILEARELAGIFLFGERLIVHSAHLFPTAMEAFERVLMLIQNTPDLDAEIAQVKQGNEQKGIIFKSGQRLLFKARSRGQLRGFTADCIVFDEAMMKLGPSEIKAVMPTVSARPNPQLIFTGSAGEEEAEQFGAMRSRAMRIPEQDRPTSNHAEKLFCWMEYSADICGYFCPKDCTQHDRIRDAAPDDTDGLIELAKTFARANPAMGYRITFEHTYETEYRAMQGWLDGSPFHIERLGIGDWPVDGHSWRVIPYERWNAQLDDLGYIEDITRSAIAISSAPELRYSCIAAGGARSDEDINVEITGYDNMLDYRPGIKWVVPRVKEIWDRFRPPFVVIAPGDPAGELIPELESLGIEVVQPTIREYAQGCGALKNGIAPTGGERPDVFHIGQAQLAEAVAAADKREIAELWVWDKTNSAADITPLVAVTLAAWGYKQHIFQKEPEPWVAFM